MKIVKEEIVYKSLDEIKEYENNPRQNDEAVEYVANSIKEFGFRNPIILDKDNVIIAGHTRYKASQQLKLKEVPCIYANDLTEEQVKAFRLADNKVGEIAEWDDDLLKIELDDILDIDMSDLGFDDIDLDVLDEETEVTEDEFDGELKDEVTIQKGDIYKLGRHRLMCGDSTSLEDVENLIDGNEIDMTFTDPPYNIAYQGVNDKRTIQNDKMSDEDFINFLEKSIMPCETMYVCCSWQYEHLFKKAMENLGTSPKAMIIWNKVNPAQHLDKYFKQHEIIFYHGKFGGEKTIRGDIWEVKRQRNTVHPTMKPIELIGIALKDNPKARNIYDGFGGSGSTLIACEELKRCCFMMELEPKYVDVIIRRWEELTGEKAELIERR